MNAKSQRPGEVRLRLGGITFSYVTTDPVISLKPTARCRPFLADTPPEIVLRLHHSLSSVGELGLPIFDSGGNWRLYEREGHPVILIRTETVDPYQIVVLDPDWLRGDIYCVGEGWVERALDPLGYPLEELLVVNALARGRGVLLHASAVKDGDRGYLFSGVSGAGKSTMAALWNGRPGVTALSDDRVIVRYHDGRFWAYGTPWHGTARISAAEAAPIDRIFVLHHGEDNEARPMRGAEAVSHVLARAFPPLWYADGMRFTLDFLSGLAQAVPCYHLGFTPTDGVVDFIRCLNVV